MIKLMFYISLAYANCSKVFFDLSEYIKVGSNIYAKVLDNNYVEKIAIDKQGRVYYKVVSDNEGNIISREVIR